MRATTPVKRLTTGALRFVAQDVADRLRTNLTPEERRELRALVAQSRDDLRAWATDRDRRRIGRLVVKALKADGG
jgi:hypothetical protein